MGEIEDAAGNDIAGVPMPDLGRGVDRHVVSEVWLDLAWELMGVSRSPGIGSPSRG